MNEPQQQSPTSSFDFNYPTIIALLYITSVVTGFGGIVGVVLAYVWKGEKPSGWEATHYDFHIRTFWFGLIGYVIGFILAIVLIGFPILLAVTIWMVVRSVIALLKAQKQEAMPDPNTLWI
jgi:uncharacterized membrane protein